MDIKCEINIKDEPTEGVEYSEAGDQMYVMTGLQEIQDGSCEPGIDIKSEIKIEEEPLDIQIKDSKSEEIFTQKSVVEKSQIYRNSPRHCFAPGCDTGYPKRKKENKSLGIRNPSLFSVGMDNNELLEKWQKAIPRKDKVFRLMDKICELHFEKDCIERDYVTKVKDGSIFTLERGKPRLKPGSVPTLFSNLPHYLSKKTNKRKAPTVRLPLRLAKKEKSSRSNIEDVCSLSDNQEQIFGIYNNLLQELGNVKKPDSMWTVSSTQDYIICAKWDDQFLSERRVAVCKDLSVKIFLKGKEIFLDIDKVTPESLSLLLERVDQLVICKEVESKIHTGCLGYLTRSSDAKLRQGLCTECSIFRRRDMIKKGKKIYVLQLGKA